ncbi:MAG: YciI family protein [Chloroflexota bacterium]
MKYLCIVYAEDRTFDAMSESELAALDEASLANDEELRRSGHLIVAQALQPVATATTVRVRNGRMSATDGPFAETTEQLGGFVFIEARDLNEAIEIAGRLPMAKIGSIEVRPVLDLVQTVQDRRAISDPPRP